MPRKPTQDVIDAAKAVLNPHDVITAVVNETPELRQAFMDNGLATEIKEGEDD